MEFPVTFEIGGLPIHPHFVFEALAYAVGFRLFLWQRRRHDVLGSGDRWTIVVAAIVGAALGSKLLVWLADPAATWNSAVADPLTLMGGKTIVGGLLGGVLAVEAAKHLSGITTRTGDAFAIPVAVGIAIGRIGCFLTGLPDNTHGTYTSLPWGVDFGDGVRHPTQIYEILFLVALVAYLLSHGRRSAVPGQQWNTFLIAYMSWRLAVGFIQPGVRFAALTTIQWAAVAAITYLHNTRPRATHIAAEPTRAMPRGAPDA